MKTIYEKQKGNPYFLQNTSGNPEIVLIFPITRDISKNSEKWKSVLEFVENSAIGTLLIIDKTELRSASAYFMDQFHFSNKRLVVFPRSINDTLFDSVGEIVLDKNMWIIQLHDDDKWNGTITLPEVAQPNSVYFSDFYLESDTKGKHKINDYSMPNRIVFSLVPATLWNRFSKLIQDHQYHVAGSFDFTFNLMAHLTCKFIYQPGFEYHWKDDNWDTSKNAIAHLTKLAQSDGWQEWSSPEIANFNRTIDCLSSLKYIDDLAGSKIINEEVQRLLLSLRPGIKKKFKYLVFIPLLKLEIMLKRIVIRTNKQKKFSTKLQSEQLSLLKFIVMSWRVKSLADVIDCITFLESTKNFDALKLRFQFWKQSIAELKEAT